MISQFEYNRVGTLFWLVIYHTNDFTVSAKNIVGSCVPWIQDGFGANGICC